MMLLGRCITRFNGKFGDGLEWQQLSPNTKNILAEVITTELWKDAQARQEAYDVALAVDAFLEYCRADLQRRKADLVAASTESDHPDDETVAENAQSDDASLAVLDHNPIMGFQSFYDDDYEHKDFFGRAKLLGFLNTDAGSLNISGDMDMDDAEFRRLRNTLLVGAQVKMVQNIEVAEQLTTATITTEYSTFTKQFKSARACRDSEREQMESYEAMISEQRAEQEVEKTVSRTRPFNYYLKQRRDHLKRLAEAKDDQTTLLALKSEIEDCEARLRALPTDRWNVAYRTLLYLCTALGMYKEHREVLLTFSKYSQRVASRKDEKKKTEVDKTREDEGFLISQLGLGFIPAGSVSTLLGMRLSDSVRCPADPRFAANTHSSLIWFLCH